ncbi:MAG: hypothetical protein L0H53_03680 [Candidatus Nitrosocosmicus sp.]|nr:hypothetical protein [Candidatus Nitrosocosmicus sp.]MDN5866826.1 hypothetical protein [Candidatus Nitrosocosmicus sp.]
MSNNQDNFSENPPNKGDSQQDANGGNADEYPIEPFTIFDYSIRSVQTKDSYFRRLRTFLQYSGIEGESFRDKCNNFAIKGQKTLNGPLG